MASNSGEQQSRIAATERLQHHVEAVPESTEPSNTVSDGQDRVNIVVFVPFRRPEEFNRDSDFSEPFASVEDNEFDKAVRELQFDWSAVAERFGENAVACRNKFLQAQSKLRNRALGDGEVFTQPTAFEGGSSVIQATVEHPVGNVLHAASVEYDESGTDARSLSRAASGSTAGASTSECDSDSSAGSTPTRASSSSASGVGRTMADLSISRIHSSGVANITRASSQGTVSSGQGSPGEVGSPVGSSVGSSVQPSTLHQRKPDVRIISSASSGGYSPFAGDRAGEDESDLQQKSLSESELAEAMLLLEGNLSVRTPKSGARQR